MEKIGQKSYEPYVWDINGEDYWIINENVSDKEPVQHVQKNVSNTSN